MHYCIKELIVIKNIDATKNFNAGAIIATPQKVAPFTKIQHVTYRALRSVHPFLHSSLFCFTVLFNWPETPEVPLPMGAPVPHVS